MKFKRILMIMLFFIIMSSPTVTALDFPITPFSSGIGQNIPTDDFIGDPDLIYYVCELKDLRTYDIYGIQSNTGAITGFPSSMADVVGTKDYVYVLLNDGNLYKIENSIGQRAFETLDFIGDDRDSILLGKYAIASQSRLVVDQSGNIYVLTNPGTTTSEVYKIDGQTYTSASFAKYGYINSISLVSDGVLMLTNTGEVRKYTAKDTYVELFDVGTTAYAIASTSDDGFIVATDNAIVQYNTTSRMGIISAAATDSGDDLLILNNGVVIFLDRSAGAIYTFTTLNNIGGFIQGDTADGLVISTVDYTNYNLYAEYNEYYNESSVKVNWLVQINSSEFFFNQDTKGLIGLYDWRIELYTPSNTFASGYNIPDSSFKWTDKYLYIFSTGDLISIGSLNYPNINLNGTWTVKLYEVNTITGDKALLITDQFNILNESSTITDGGTVPINNETTVYDLIFSKYFIGLIGFVAIVKSIGTDRFGKINGTMAVMGVIVADIVLVLAGFFPIWTIFVLVLFGLITLGKRISDGGN